MFKILIFISFIFISSRFYGLTFADINELEVQTYCDILDVNATKIKSFPGSFCIFRDDGSVIYASPTHLTLADKNDTIIWETAGDFHHQIKLSLDQKKILTLDSKLVSIKNKKYKSDLASIYNLDGSLDRSIDAQNLIEQAKLKLTIQNTTLPDNPKYKDAKGEVAHLNSFYEIPQHSNLQKSHLIPPGGYVINGLYDGVFILDRKLEKVLYHFKFPFAKDNFIHDVQITKKGTFLIFVNLFNLNPEIPGEFHHSAAVEYDPFFNKILWKFTATPKEMFFSPATGGIQELDENTILISDYIKGFFVINKKDNSIIFPYYNLKNLENSSGYTNYQDIKLYNLDKFLKQRKLKKN